MTHRQQIDVGKWVLNLLAACRTSSHEPTRAEADASGYRLALSKQVAEKYANSVSRYLM